MANPYQRLGGHITFALGFAAFFCCVAPNPARARDNHSPVCNAKTLEVEPQGESSATLRINPIVLSPACFDPDGDKLSLQAVGAPATQAVGPSGRKTDMIQVNLDSMRNRPLVIAFRVTDGKGGYAESTVTLSVRSVDN